MRKFPYVPVLLAVAAFGGLLYFGMRSKPAVDRSKVPVGTGSAGLLDSIAAGTVFTADISKTLNARNPLTNVPGSAFTALSPVDQAGVFQGFTAYVRAKHNISGELVDVPITTIQSVGGIPIGSVASTPNDAASTPPFGSLPGVQPGRFEELQGRMKRAGFN